MRTRRPLRWLAVPLAGALVIAACGGDDDDDDGGAAATTAAPETTGAPATTAAPGTTGAPATSAAPGTTGGPGTTGAAGDVDLSADCPATIVLQTDWNPEAEHGWLYELFGDDYEIDAGAVLVRGSLVTSGEVDTGVDLEIRSGGPAIGFQTVTSQMYTDDSILLGFVYTDEAIQNSAEFPTVAIESGMEKNPQMVMWDPATYPEVESIADLGPAGVEAGKIDAPVTIRYFSGAAYMDYYREAGILTAGQLDDSYDGTPANFIAAQGADAQQGFGSAEPYIYENEVPDWGKPVAYEYINDAGWPNYAQSIATKPENVETYRACFEKLVPMIQQATVDYMNDPDETNALIIEAVEAFANGWVYSQGVADYAVETMRADGLIANGTDGTIGSFDVDRVDDLIEKAIPIYSALGQAPADGLTAEDIVTNEFIDETISL